MTPDIAETVERLRALGGDQFVAELFSSYLAQSEENVATIRKAMQTGDVASVGVAAHTLKGSSGAIGAFHLADLSSKIDEAIRIGKTADLQTQVDGLFLEFEIVRKAVTQFAFPT
jgi:two-component system sensor histidine kinase/response regulator